MTRSESLSRRDALVSMLSAATLVAVPGTAACQRIASDKRQRHIVRHRLEDFGVVGGSRGNAVVNTAAINRALLTLGRPIEGRAGERYNVAPNILVPSGAGVVGSGEPFTFFMPAANFTNVAPWLWNAPTATLFRLDGGRARPKISDVLFEGFTVLSDSSGGRGVTAFFVSNVDRFRAQGVEIAGLPNGYGFKIGSVKGDSHIVDCHIHDFFDSSVVDANGRPWAKQVQSTGICVDDFRSNGVSDPLKITNNRIRNIMKGDDFARLRVQGGDGVHPRGMQTDGINIRSCFSKGHDISDNLIENVDEAIDCFGSFNTIHRNSLLNLSNAGLKFIHGAQGNVANGNVIRNAGLWGIVFGATSTAGRETSGNIVSGATISGIGYNRVQWAPCGVRVMGIAARAGVYQARNNLVKSTRIILTDAAYDGWFGDTDADEALNNEGRDISFVGEPSRSRIDIPRSRSGFYNGRVMLAGETAYRTTLK